MVYVVCHVLRVQWPVLSVREESRGQPQAAFCLLAASWMLCNLHWSQPVPGDSGGWSQVAVKYIVCLANGLGFVMCCCLWS